MLVLIAHGSRDPEWRGSLGRLRDAVRADAHSEEIQLAFMQFEGPTLHHVVEEGISRGDRSFRLLPLFMASAGHVDKDIRPLVEELAKLHPEAELVLLDPVGESPLFPDLINKIVHNTP